MGDSTCIEAACMNKPARSGRGYCHKHYLAKLADGSLTHLIKKRQRSPRPSQCSVNECDKQPRVKGYCVTHYHRWLRHGDPNQKQVRVRSFCTVENCDKPVNTQSLCVVHYWRVQRYGSTDLPEPKPLVVRFYEQVDTTAGLLGCHPWTGHCDQDGYGAFSVKGKYRRAARWILGHSREEPLAASEWALHRCDNPPCVNLEHLYIGDAVQNAADREKRGRTGRRPKPTQCRNGHEYTPENVFFEYGGQRCIICRKASNDRKVAKLRERRVAARARNLESLAM